MTEIQKFRVKIVKEESSFYDIDRIHNPDDAARLFREVLELDQEPQEVVALVTLDIKNHITGVFEASRGSLSSSIVHPREVFQRAILQNAGAIVLGHNHPSGDPEPSREDIQITERLKEAGKILGIEVLDHIIIGNGYLSMKKEGLI